MESMMVNENMMQEFQTIWSHYDQHATGYIKVYEFDAFLADLVRADSELVAYRKWLKTE